MRSAPGLTIVAVLTLGLGIGPTTAIFAIVNAVFFHPLPCPNPEELIYIKESLPISGPNPFVGSKEFLAWQQHSQTVRDLSGYIDSEANFVGPGGSERVNAVKVTATFFPLLGVRPALGRVFTAGEDRPGAADVAMLTYAFWVTRFNGDRSVVGRPLALNGKLYTIVGVLPQGFEIPDRYQFHRDVWIPFDIAGRKGAFTLVRAVGRLRPGVSQDAVRSELQALLQSVYPKRTKLVLVSQWQEEIGGGIKRPVALFLGAVSLVLLIACVNIVCLLLTRAAARSKEIAVRLALGACRSDILRQLLTESAAIALLGGFVGLALGLWAKGVFVAFLSSTLPLEEIGLDYRVFAFNFLVSGCAAIAFGIVPALKISKVELSEAFKQGGAGAAGGHRRLRRYETLLAAEIALVVPVFVCVILLVRSFLALQSTDLGFRLDRSLCLTIDLTPASYPNAADQSRFFERALERVRAISGVTSAAATDSLPLGNNSSTVSDVPIEGRQGLSASADWSQVTPGYFTTLGISFREGRDFSVFDRTGQPDAVIVSETFARTYFPRGSCLGKRIGNWLGGTGWLTVIGVVADARSSIDRPAPPQAYLSYLQHGSPLMTLVIRTALDPVKLVVPVRREINALDSNEPPYGITTLSEVYSSALLSHRANMMVATVFGTVALLLIISGIYGILSYLVGQRFRELGVRVALGARPRNLVITVLGRALVAAGLGEAAGVVCALAFSRVMSTMVVGIETTDTATYLGVCLLCTLTTLAASSLPVGCAIRVDPVTALRSE